MFDAQEGQAPQAAPWRLTGAAKGGTTVTFGDFGIQALEPGWLTFPASRCRCSQGSPRPRQAVSWRN